MFYTQGLSILSQNNIEVLECVFHYVLSPFKGAAIHFTSNIVYSNLTVLRTVFNYCISNDINGAINFVSTHGDFHLSETCFVECLASSHTAFGFIGRRISNEYIFITNTEHDMNRQFVFQASGESSLLTMSNISKINIKSSGFEIRGINPNFHVCLFCSFYKQCSTMSYAFSFDKSDLYCFNYTNFVECSASQPMNMVKTRVILFSCILISSSRYELNCNCIKCHFDHIQDQSFDVTDCIFNSSTPTYQIDVKSCVSLSKCNHYSDYQKKRIFDFNYITCFLIENSLFIETKSDSNGGCIFLKPSFGNITILYSSFQSSSALNNLKNSQGGAIYLDGETSLFQMKYSCVFSCFSDNSHMGFLWGSSISLVLCSIVACSPNSDIHGPITLMISKGILSCNSSKNYASDYPILSGVFIEITQSNLQNNNAISGTGANSKNIWVNYSNFIGNKVEKFIIFSNNLYVKSCSFFYNSPNLSFRAIFDLLFGQCTFDLIPTGSFIYTQNCSITNSIFLYPIERIDDTQCYITLKPEKEGIDLRAFFIIIFITISLLLAILLFANIKKRLEIEKNLNLEKQLLIEFG